MIIKLNHYPGISSFASVGGKAEYEGPVGKMLDRHSSDEYFGMKTWEQAESEMQRLALSIALDKAQLKDTDVDMVFAGDLINQCTSSAYGLLDYSIPYAGLYGACSTCAEAIALASVFADGYNQRCAAVTSSHFCSAERQFRFPLEYAAQRAPVAQRTVTGSGAFIIERGKGSVRVADVMFGVSVDSGINDLNNMGAAMAPAAADSLARYFNESKTKPSDYDAIFSGDLGKQGRKLTIEILSGKGYDMCENYDDCGLLVYNVSVQDMHSGGSGCGCSAIVLATKILADISSQKYKNVLFMATGALMSPVSVQQGQNIPSIAHIVHFVSEVK